MFVRSSRRSKNVRWTNIFNVDIVGFVRFFPMWIPIETPAQVSKPFRPHIFELIFEDVVALQISRLNFQVQRLKRLAIR